MNVVRLQGEVYPAIAVIQDLEAEATDHHEQRRGLLHKQPLIEIRVLKILNEMNGDLGHDSILYWAMDNLG